MLVLSGITALLLLSLFAAPALGAQKVIDARQQNIRSSFGISGNICGPLGLFTADFHFAQTSFVLWDNNRFQATFSGSVQVTDSGGKLIFREHLSQRQVTGTGFLPLTMGFNDVGTCGGGSATPGKLFGFHFTITFGEDGLVKQVHFIAN